MTIEQLGKPIRVGNKTAPNRIVYQPTESNNCDDRGSPTRHTFDKYTAIARGKPGIIHIESIDVTTKTQARSNRMLILEENLPGLKKLVAEIRKLNDESLIVFQLSHAGRLSDPAFKPAYTVYDTGDAAVRVMSTEEIVDTREEFVASARRAREAGADGIDFKQAHGFIADDFLHPANNRKDRYGGSWENRTRFFRETIARMREEIKDPGFLIGSRISPYEGIPGGFGTSGPDEMIEDLSEPIAFAQLMEKEGIDFINVSAGFASANLEILMPTSTYPEGVFRHFTWTRAIKDAVSVPVIGSGYSRLKDGDDALHIPDRDKRTFVYWAEKNLREGHVDLVGVGRQAIADPAFARKLLEGRLEEIHWCITCNECGALLGANQRIGCTIFDKEYRALLRSVQKGKK
jgi:2,4-dienoyl-CoA reductase-like NADH-dependent reductase (Old Yellow Enzyme family)